MVDMPFISTTVCMDHGWEVHAVNHFTDLSISRDHVLTHWLIVFDSLRRAPPVGPDIQGKWINVCSIMLMFSLIDHRDGNHDDGTGPMGRPGDDERGGHVGPQGEYPPSRRPDRADYDATNVGQLAHVDGR